MKVSLTEHLPPDEAEHIVNLANNVARSVNRYTTISHNYNRGVTLLTNAIGMEKMFFTVEEHKDDYGDLADFYEDMYHTAWRAVESCSVSKVIETLKEMEDEYMKLGYPAGCGSCLIYPREFLVEYLATMLMSSAGEAVSGGDGVEAYKKVLKEEFVDTIDNIEDFINLLHGPAVRRLAGIFEEGDCIQRALSNTARAIKVGKNTIMIEFDNAEGVPVTLSVNHPEVDEILRCSSTELLDKRKKVKKAVKNVKNQIMGML